MVPSLIHMVTLDSTLNFFYYKYQSVYSLSVISKDHMLTESIRLFDERVYTQKIPTHMN